MDPTKRTSWKIWTIGAVTLAALFLASNASANDRHHSHVGARINAHLDFLAVVAALSGEPYLAAALDHRGDHIEHDLDRQDRTNNHRSDHWRKRVRRHHRHFDGCGHGYVSHRSNHNRSSWRRSRDDRHEDRRHRRHHKRHRKSRHDRHDRHSRH